MANKTISSDMTKQELANTLGILLGMNDMTGQFMKLSLPALNAMYYGINKNLMAFSIAEDRAREAESAMKIQKARCATLEREVRSLTKKQGKK